VCVDAPSQATNVNDEPIGIIYFVGIIDILQPYNAAKAIEHYWCVSTLSRNDDADVSARCRKSIRNDSTTISSIAPDKYAQRFIDFLGSVTGCVVRCMKCRARVCVCDAQHDSTPADDPENEHVVKLQRRGGAVIPRRSPVPFVAGARARACVCFGLSYVCAGRASPPPSPEVFVDKSAHSNGVASRRKRRAAEPLVAADAAVVPDDGRSHARSPRSHRN
jgi:hypothetical protein